MVMLPWIKWSSRETREYFGLSKERFGRLKSTLFTDDEQARFFKRETRRSYCLDICGIQGRTRYMTSEVVEAEAIVRISMYMRVQVPSDVIAAFEGRMPSLA